MEYLAMKYFDRPLFVDVNTVGCECHPLRPPRLIGYCSVCKKLVVLGEKFIIVGDPDEYQGSGSRWRFQSW